MMSSVQTFLNMGGYATYVWPAYGSVLLFLFGHWFLAFRRMCIQLNKKKEKI
jgi:heme exporter protein CcmD